MLTADSFRPEGRFRDLHDMERALLSAIGSTPPPEEPLEPVARRRGYELNFAEARAGSTVFAPAS